MEIARVNTDQYVSGFHHLFILRQNLNYVTRDSAADGVKVAVDLLVGVNVEESRADLGFDVGGQTGQLVLALLQSCFRLNLVAGDTPAVK